MRTYNTAIFGQDMIKVREADKLESIGKPRVFISNWSLEDRKLTGFKFGFVVTKLRK